jgi:hypothetical protein
MLLLTGDIFQASISEASKDLFEYTVFRTEFPDEIIIQGEESTEEAAIAVLSELNEALRDIFG